MFESQYNDEMEAEVRRLESRNRALAAGHPEWENACAGCGCELETQTTSRCENCSLPVITVVARIAAKQDCIEAVKVELLKMVPPTRKEEGCIEYRLHQDNADPALFLFFESWTNLACLERHMNSPHFTAYVRAVEGMIAEKAVQNMTSLC